MTHRHSTRQLKVRQIATASSFRLYLQVIAVTIILDRVSIWLRYVQELIVQGDLTINSFKTGTNVENKQLQIDFLVEWTKL
jgi:hypothetical protein